MEIKQIRYKNARQLVTAAGGVSAFAEKIEKSQSQASAIAGANPHKGIGAKIAREIEKSFNKPEFWLDSVHPETELEIQAEMIREAFIRCSPELREAARRMLGILEEKD